MLGLTVQERLIIAAVLAGIVAMGVCIAVGVCLWATMPAIPTLAPSFVVVRSPTSFVMPEAPATRTLPPPGVTVERPATQMSPAPAVSSTPAPETALTPTLPVVIMPELAFSETVTVPQTLTVSAPTPAPTPWLGQHAYPPDPLGYLLYLPPDYGRDPQQKWPLVLFLHGIGERGDDPERLTAQGLPKLASLGRHFPFILLAPQCPLDKFWPDLYPPLLALLDNIQSRYQVDPRRIYLTGISMGGYGAMGLAQEAPDRFAALVPIAGGYTWDPNIAVAGHYTGDLDAPIPKRVCALQHTPVWLFHGLRDQVIPPSQSQHIADALIACGSEPAPKLTFYDTADHVESWERAYDDAELYTWMLSQSK